ncbi:MAG: Nascent polypeptide-associated complex protein, partial [Candidatus Omnitrophica bacterium]|nr:Nascent polypeptide-associated complex protein [Candidatus Omnitrophota bacterium]
SSMGAQKSCQITGEAVEGVAGKEGATAATPAEESGPSEQDIAMVAEQAKTTKEKAKAALEETAGDIAEAIMLLETE